MRDESRKLIAAVLAVADCHYAEDDGEWARQIATLEERMQNWFRAKGWAPPSGTGTAAAPTDGT
ncbi:MAG TPA: hypothetical protein VMK42_06370 [Anaeromyxobacteraceae bacterium]|nr:hypothetical protein [Anaeromyxobacteraceae bacterium]